MDKYSRDNSNRIRWMEVADSLHYLKLLSKEFGRTLDYKNNSHDK